MSEPKQNPERKALTIRLPPDLLRQVRVLAALHDRRLNGEIEVELRYYVDTLPTGIKNLLEEETKLCQVQS